MKKIKNRVLKKIAVISAVIISTIRNKVLGTGILEAQPMYGTTLSPKTRISDTIIQFLFIPIILMIGMIIIIKKTKKPVLKWMAAVFLAVLISIVIIYIYLIIIGKIR